MERDANSFLEPRDEGNTWDAPALSPAQIAERVLEVSQESVLEITRNITLRGDTARNYLMAFEMVKGRSGWTDAEVDAYLLRGGARREWERMAAALQKSRENQGG